MRGLQSVVPFNAAIKSLSGEIRAANIGRIDIIGSVKEIGLRVESELIVTFKDPELSIRTFS